MLLDDQRVLRIPVSLSPSFSVMPPALDPPLRTRPLCEWSVPHRTMRRIAIGDAVLRERVSLPRGGLVYRHDYDSDPIRGDIDPSPARHAN